jgi:hypothetical protein
MKHHIGYKSTVDKRASWMTGEPLAGWHRPLLAPTS